MVKAILTLICIIYYDCHINDFCWYCDKIPGKRNVKEWRVSFGYTLEAIVHHVMAAES